MDGSGVVSRTFGLGSPQQEDRDRLDRFDGFDSTLHPVHLLSPCEVVRFLFVTPVGTQKAPGSRVCRPLEDPVEGSMPYPITGVVRRDPDDVGLCRPPVRLGRPFLRLDGLCRPPVRLGPHPSDSRHREPQRVGTPRPSTLTYFAKKRDRDVHLWS